MSEPPAGEESVGDLLPAAEAAAAAGDTGAVLAAWRRATDAPGELGDDGLETLALLLVECGELAEAGKALARLGDTVRRARLTEEVLSEAVENPAETNPAEPDPDDDLDLELSGTERRELDGRLVQEFSKWFGGRRDLYARQWYDESRRRSGYRPVREPLTADVVRQHLEGRMTVGQYLLYPDATVSYAVIDLDLSASAMAELRAVHGPGASALQHAELRQYAGRILDVAGRMGVCAFPEDSGGRGAHLWIFFSPRRPARAARAVLSQILVGAGSAPADVGSELFPKQEALGPSGLSSLVKLPLGIHLVTLHRCPLLDARLEPIDDPLVALGALRVADPAVVDAVVGRRLVPLPAPERVAGEAPLPLPVVSSPRSLAEALRGIGEGKPAKQAAEQMLAGCGVLSALVRKAYTERHLTPGEARAIAYTLGLVGSSCEIADGALRAANASLKELERARRGLPSPAGCARLARLGVPDAPCCGCPGGAKGAPYPTPTLFAVGSRAPAAPRHTPFAPWLNAGESAVEGPLDAVMQTLGRIEKKLEHIEPADPPHDTGGHE